MHVGVAGLLGAVEARAPGEHDIGSFEQLSLSAQELGRCAQKE